MNSELSINDKIACIIIEYLQSSRAKKIVRGKGVTPMDAIGFIYLHLIRYLPENFKNMEAWVKKSSECQLKVYLNHEKIQRI